MEAYLDNSATTRVFPEVAELMTKIMCDDYGNPSSLHMKGVQAEQYLRYARETLAGLLKAGEKEIIFTSGGTEADNLALIGAAFANRRKGNHVITTQVEHPAVLKTCEYLESVGYRVTYLPVNAWGQISLEDLQRAMTPETILVSIMHTNNEIGALQPVAEAGALIKRINPQTLFHVDGVQGFGKARIYPGKMNIDLLSVSGHKIHGPKGIGFLYMGEKVRIQPIIHGGGQQWNLRSGTDNVPGVRSEVLLHALEEKGIYVSAGSACAARKPQPSATLKAIGVEQALLGATIRFSFSVYTTVEELDYTLRMMYDKIPMLRKYTRR